MPKPSRVDFLDQVAELVVGRFPLVKLDKDASVFSLRINGHWASLENLYRIHLQQPEHLQRHVERWVAELLRSFEGSPDETAPFEDVRERVMPVILSTGPRDIPGSVIITQNLLEGLAVGYAIDSERTIAYISRRLFAQWDMPIEELHETALGNLVSRSETLAAHAAGDSEGDINLILIQTLDGYDASRILLPGLHDRLREHLGSPFLCGIPNRDILICFKDEPEMVERMTKQIQQDYQTMPHQISSKPYLVTADGIAPYSDE